MFGNVFVSGRHPDLDEESILVRFVCAGLNFGEFNGYDTSGRRSFQICEVEEPATLQSFYHMGHAEALLLLA